MEEGTETVEQRLKSLLSQLQTEFGIFERLVYKNKNQHRRSSYFQFLTKVRRDLRLLRSANLEELFNSCFQVINGKSPKQKVQLLESLKRKGCDSGKPNFLERLLGAARLLSQMTEPILKASIEISTLLAQSFFMGFSLTILALLARMRVLIQQMLLDVVSTFNTVSSLSQKEHAVQIVEGGLQVFREYYPTRRESIISLKCVWQKDKYVLVEKVNENTDRSQKEELEEDDDVTVGASAIQYQSVNALLGGDQPSNMEPTDFPREIAASNHNLFTAASSSSSSSSSSSCVLQQNNQETGMKDSWQPTAAVPSSEKNSMAEERDLTSSLTTPLLNPLKRKCASKGKVAFLSVKAAPAFTRVNNNLDSTCTTISKVDE